MENQPAFVLSMQNFNEFIKEVQSFQVNVKMFYQHRGSKLKIEDTTPNKEPGLEKIIDLDYCILPYLDASHYGETSDYDNKLASMQEAAISELLNFTAVQIRAQLTWLQGIKKKFDNFLPIIREFHNYYFKITENDCEFFNDGIGITHKKRSDFEIALKSYFSVNSHDYGNIDIYFVQDLLEGVHAKEGSLLSFERQILKHLEETSGNGVLYGFKLCQGNPFDLILPEFHDLINRVEKRIEAKIFNWKAGKDKIGCAAFVELLYEKKYFRSKNRRRSDCNKYAQMKYGIDIYAALNTNKENERRPHKERLICVFRTV